MRRLLLSALALSLVLCGSTVSAQELFSRIVGPVSVRPVQPQDPLRVPFITWGGDVATFLANGGLQTQPDSIYAAEGLNIQLTPGDDFVTQVKDYVSGKSPFLRGTFRMLGQASEVIGSDPRTKPVVILQLSWSAGDHIVSRKELRSLDDIQRGGDKIRIACQQGGPHVGMLYDVLQARQLQKEDVEIVFVPDLTGDNGPAEKFRTDPTIDACCVITPDMIGLTGGLESTGTGAEGTVEGAHVLVSTQNMSRSIADVYAVRNDWFSDNRETVEKFVAGYLKATEEVIRLRDDFEANQLMSSEHRTLLTMAQQIFGEEVLPTLEVDAHGLLLDCRFVGLPGQIAFFEQKGNLNGFDPAGFDYRKIASMAGVEYTVPNVVETSVGGEGITEFPDSVTGENTIVSFTIAFEPNDPKFSVDRYGAEFNRALQMASTFGGAAVVIRGHADPTKTLVNLIKAGMAKGVITRTGSQGNYRYFLRTQTGSKELDLNQTDDIVGLINDGVFEGAADSPLQTMQAARNLSLARAEAVKSALTNYARNQGINVNLSQLQPVGAGISDPVISKPTSIEDAKKNMRVEFRIVKVDPETLSESDFDY